MDAMAGRLVERPGAHAVRARPLVRVGRDAAGQRMHGVDERWSPARLGSGEPGQALVRPPEAIDQELAELFSKAQHESAKGAELAKSLLARRLNPDISAQIEALVETTIAETGVSCIEPPPARKRSTAR